MRSEKLFSRAMVKTPFLFMCFLFVGMAVCLSCEDEGDKYPGPCTIEQDIDDDGTFDIVDTYFYDSEDKLIRVEVLDNDEPYYNKYYSYDSKGNETKYEIDWDVDGVDYVRLKFYDDKGYLIRKEADGGDGYSGNGPIDGITDDISYYTYDSSNVLVKTEHDGEMDDYYNHVSDGVIDDITFFYYDENGNLIREEQDRDMDDIVDSIWLYVYDSDNNLIEIGFDFDEDGIMDIIQQKITYDDSGNVILCELDSVLAGKFDISFSYEYDNYGNLLKETRTNRYSVRTTYYTYDCWK